MPGPTIRITCGGVAFATLLLMLLPAFAVSDPGEGTDEPSANASPSDDSSNAASEEDAVVATVPEKVLLSGKVVMLREALKRRGIKTFDEMKGQVALATTEGELLPIVSDWRGRAFYQDKRLRNREVDLVAYRREGVPYIQVLMVFTFDEKGKRQYTDYWCDICAIPMYEIKPCDCCQGPIELRFQHQQLPEYLLQEKGDGPDAPSGKDAPTGKQAAPGEGEKAR